MGRQVAIVGVGLHPWGVFPQKSMPEMAVEAITEALQDAQMEWREIQAMVNGAYLFIADKAGVPGTLQGTFITQLMGDTGIPIVNVNNACATGQSLLREACMTVASGDCDVAIAVAADKSSGGFFRPQSHDPSDVDYVRYVMTGETNPAYWAMECRRRMNDVGTTEQDLAMCKVITSKGAVNNPKARYRKAYRLEEVMNSPIVAEPLRLFEICATSDGAGAIIVTTLAKAKKYTKKPILVEAAAVGTSSYGDSTVRLLALSSFPRPGVLDLTESRNALKSVYKKAKRRPEDLDIIELPDLSSWHYLAYLDCILELGPGEAEKLLRRGDTDPIDGKIPVSTGGGVSASGEAVVAQGVLQVYELVKQLRREANGWQVKKEAKVGLAQTYGYAGNNSACILSRAW